MSMNRPSESPPAGRPGEELNEYDRIIVSRIDSALERARALKSWWERAVSSDGFDQRFGLERTFNRPDSSYGFFGRAPLSSGLMSVMGNVQEMFYDSGKLGPGPKREHLEWLREQLREYVLNYFMRISDFRQPEAFHRQMPDALPNFLRPLSWCSQPRPERTGFGFSQLYYRLRSNGAVGKFRKAEEHAIVDLREIGRTYDWIVLKVQIFDFRFSLRPFGDAFPTLSFELEEESYLVITADFILDESRPDPHVLGRYGLGYAFIKTPTDGALGYGPGQFDAAFELIQFSLLNNGETRVRMAFVANRPDRILRLKLHPLFWASALADFMTLGLLSPYLETARRFIRPWELDLGELDPLLALIGVVNLLSAGEAGRRLCISREHLEKAFLVQHFRQHYETITGSLLTWRQIPDWLNRSALPEWVVSGVSS